MYQRRKEKIFFRARRTEMTIDHLFEHSCLAEEFNRAGQMEAGFSPHELINVRSSERTSIMDSFFLFLIRRIMSQLPLDDRR